MAGKRSYQDGCAAAHALELIGERWALLVVRELMLGPRRFTDLRKALPGISPNVLTQRLQELERAAIVVRSTLPMPISIPVYALTEWGQELEPVIRDIGRWAARSPNMPQGLPMSVNSLVLSLRTMFSPETARGVSGRLELRLDGMPFDVRIGEGKLEIVPGHAEGAQAVVACGPDVLAGVLYGGEDLTQAVHSGAVNIEGDEALVHRFAALFPLPEPAPACGA